MFRETIHIVAIALCLLILIMIELKVVSPSLQDATLLSRFIAMQGYHPNYNIVINEEELEDTSTPGFTVIIVTFNEPLLYKT